MFLNSASSGYILKGTELSSPSESDGSLIISVGSTIASQNGSPDITDYSSVEIVFARVVNLSLKYSRSNKFYS
jgi:hypothetical protein